MLDASAQQKVTDGRSEIPAGESLHAARPSFSADPAGARWSRPKRGSSKPKNETNAKPRGFRFPNGVAKNTGKSSPHGRPSTVPRSSTSPGSSAKGRRKKIPVHSHKGSAKWSFGGLTVSIRTLVGIAVSVVLLTTLVPLGLQWMKQEQAYRAVVAEVAQAQAKNEAMRDELADWENEDYVAAKARERLGFVRPGETQFVVTDAPNQQSGAEQNHPDAHKGPAKPWMWHVAEALKDADQPQPSTTTGLAGADGAGDSEGEVGNG